MGLSAAAPVPPPSPLTPGPGGPNRRELTNTTPSSSDDDAGPPSGSSPSRTEQRPPWSRHLQLAHAPPKWPGNRRHSGKGRGPGCAVRHATQERTPRLPRDWIRTAFTYDGREDPICAGVIRPNTNRTSRPGRARTSR